MLDTVKKFGRETHGHVMQSRVEMGKPFIPFSTDLNAPVPEDRTDEQTKPEEVNETDLFGITQAKRNQLL